jgi:hypothetical protein
MGDLWADRPKGQAMFLVIENRELAASIERIGEVIAIILALLCAPKSAAAYAQHDDMSGQSSVKSEVVV